MLSIFFHLFELSIIELYQTTQPDLKPWLLAGLEEQFGDRYHRTRPSEPEVQSPKPIHSAGQREEPMNYVLFLVHQNLIMDFYH